ncbi:DUF2779 domain-containing protein [Mycoplasma enhydrae]|uniref:DUF2779 domain-containing protein n=1 Tax=Mycoplasma enhydrae TaxID=2499220 RepID=UPI0021E86869|nr:DUF2779 domain-containing protein [Mycoplasma enhydrae]MCV3753390.1 DUF2779 domain-containing protein [Mycoplasma enhydrae]
MKKNKTKYTFNDFVIANNTRPWFIFNELSDELIKQDHNQLVNMIESLEEDNDDSKFNSLDLLDFNLDKIDSIIDEYVVPVLKEKQATEIKKLSPYDKLGFLKKEIAADAILQKKFDEETELKNINFLFNMFGNVEIINSGLNLVVEQATKFLKDFYKENFNFEDSEIKYISDSQTTENKIKETQAAINNNAKLIINAHFEYKSCVSKVTYFDLKNGIFGNLNYSIKTKRKNLLKSYYDYQIISNFLEINKITILRPKYLDDRKVRKGVLKFELNEYCSVSKAGVTSSSYKDLNSESEINAILIGNPNYEYTRKKLKNKNETIIQHVKNELSSAGYNLSEKKSADKSSNSCYTCSFKEFLELIDSKEEIVENWQLIEDDFKDNFSPSWFSILIKKIYPQYPFGSKKFFRLLSGNFQNEGYALNNTWYTKSVEFFNNNRVAIDKKIFKENVYKAINDMEAKIAWFDFEGVTLPVPLVDYLKAWNQTIAQTSIIKTLNNEIYESKDYVYDPLNMNINTYKKIINDLYDEEIKYYVVYNQAYEKSRLEELKKRLGYYCEINQLSDEEFNDYKQKLNYIIEKIVDLADLFKTAKNKPPIINDRIINIGYIRGNYSIKKLEYYVTQNNLSQHLKHKIKPYSDLNVKNGSAALSIATTRALDKIGPNEWESKQKDLKEYCHNDVMAMLMVADLVKYLVKDEQNFKNFEEYNF